VCAGFCGHCRRARVAVRRSQGTQVSCACVPVVFACTRDTFVVCASKRQTIAGKRKLGEASDALVRIVSCCVMRWHVIRNTRTRRSIALASWSTPCLSCPTRPTPCACTARARISRRSPRDRCRTRSNASREKGRSCAVSWLMLRGRDAQRKIVNAVGADYTPVRCCVSVCRGDLTLAHVHTGSSRRRTAASEDGARDG
jgi:hypothetical protein